MVRTIEKYLQDARYILDKYSDEIPKEIIHNTHSHKVSKGYWTTVGLMMENAAYRGFVSKEYIEKFGNYVEKTKFVGRLTTHEDLEFINKLFGDFIKELESKTK